MLSLLDKIEATVDKWDKRLAIPSTQLPCPPKKPKNLLDFVPWCSPKFSPPAHLAPLVELLERTRGGPVFATTSVPPRHAKTETILHWIALCLSEDPSLNIAYVTYGDRLSKSKSRKARRYAQRAGVHLDPKANAAADWRTVAGGGLLATSIGGALTGEGADILVIDDPVKDRAAAESKAQRDSDWAWFEDVGLTRVEPGGSVIVNMTRWHEDDLAGRCASVLGYESVNLEAIDSSTGAALWPERWPADCERFETAKKNPYTWASLYMGSPMPRGGKVFNSAHQYDELPAHGYRVGAGVDLAYTESTRADRSVMVVGRKCEGRLYIENIVAVREEADRFASRVKAFREQNPGAPIRWYGSGVEKGVAQSFKRLGAPIQFYTTNKDKFSRALNTSTAWNNGQILMPSRAPWLSDALEEILGFTGVSDVHDDIVDALVALWDALCLDSSGFKPPRKTRAMGAGVMNRQM